jgi:hypothetical protein
MSEDVWNNETAPKSLTVDQLMKLEATSSAAHMEVELCYSLRKAFIKPLKVLDKKELLKAMENKNENLVNKVFDNILEKYVEIEDFNDSMDSLYMAERQQLLASIRTANGDDTASIIHVCPGCENANTINYDLSNLSIKNYVPNEDNDVVTHDIGNGITVEYHIKPLTRVDEKMAENNINQEKITLETEKYMIRMSGFIHKIIVIRDGERSPVEFKSYSDKINIYKNLDGVIESKIKTVLRRFDFGVKMPFQFKCQHCEYEEKNDEVNVGAFFIS